jgi:F0F1-type ATP synthase assembly protein I
MAVSYGLVGAIVLFGAVGYLLDRTLNTAPWLVISGVLVGVAVGFYAVGMLIRRT